MKPTSSCRQLFFLFTAIMLFCLPVKGISQKTSKPAVETPKNDEQIVMSILFQQQAAEYRALCLQSYNIAKWKVMNVLKNAPVSAHPLPFAIVTDLDETALDNSKFEAQQYLHNNVYNPKDFGAWCKMGIADAVPGSIAFFNCIDSLRDNNGQKIDIYYVSNRADSLIPATLENMKKLGLPQTENSHFLFQTTQTTSSKESRRQDILKDHNIILLLGDNLVDLSKNFDKVYNAEERKKKVDELQDKWGDIYIVFPNAIYGDWEQALYDGKYGPMDAEKAKRISLLKGY